MSLHDDKRLVEGAKRLFANGRSFPNLVSTRLTQFPYFDELLGHPAGKAARSSILAAMSAHFSPARATT